MRWQLAALLLLIVVAFAVRSHDLEAQSLWSDEGLTLHRLGLPVKEILRNVITVDGVETHDTNPPLYFLLLHGWRYIAGESVWALRFLGAIAGVLSVPLLFVLGARVLSKEVGLYAAALLAISPYHVWHCQEMRNYSLLLVTNLVSIYGLCRFALSQTDRQSYKGLALWALAGLAGVYTHYFGFFVLAFGVVSLLVLYRRQRWIWLGLAATALAALPLVPFAYSRFTAGQQVDFVQVPVSHLLSHAASIYTVGIAPTIVQPVWRVLPGVLLAAGGAALAWRAKRKAALLLLGYQIVPLGILVILSAINPLYNGPRHLLIGLPPFLVLVATSLGSSPGRWRWASLALGAGLVVSQIHWLNVQFTSPDLIKDDIKEAAHYLNQVVRPDDVVIIHDALVGFVFDYYYQGAAPWTAIPAYGEENPEAAIARLASLGQTTAGRVWFLVDPRPRTGFPRDVLVQWARDQWPRVFGRRFEWLWLNVKLEAYLPQANVARLPDGAERLEVRWGEELALAGYQSADDVGSGGPWWPSLFWSKLRGQVPDMILSWRLVDPAGTIWAEMENPLWSLYPPSGWPEGRLIRHEQEVQLPIGLPPGEYQVWLRLLDAEDHLPVRTSQGQESVRLMPNLTVTSSTARSAISPLPLSSAIQLLSRNWPEAEYRPGYPLPLELTWLVRRRPAVDYRVRLSLLDEQGEVVAESESAPTRADYPATAWQPGETLLCKASVLIPPQTPSDQYSVQISLVNSETGDPTRVRRGRWPLGQRTLMLGDIQVTEWPLQIELPPMEHARTAELGFPTLADLLGYDLTKSGNSLTVILYWRARQYSSDSLAVLVHVTGPDGQIVGQGDGIPAEGLRPTTTWRPGEIIVDPHTVALAPGLPAGSYHLWTGLYGDERLPVLVDGLRQADDRILLDTIQLAP